MLKYVIKDLSEFSDAELKESFSFMNSARKEKVIRLKNDPQKKLTLAGELLARQLLSSECECPIDSYDIFAEKNGKLKQRNKDNLFFNISHSENKIAVVISDEEVGIDIEVFRPMPIRLAKRICTEKELMYIFGHLPEEYEYEQSNDSNFLRRFFEIWTAKEAYFKCIGTGITDLGKMKSLSTDFNKIKILTDEYVAHIVKSSDI